MGAVPKRDFERRARKPQSRAMMRKILREFSNVSQGGIHLPNGRFEQQYDEYRIQRVVLKIVRGLFYIDRKTFMPEGNAKDIRLCLGEEDAIELYRLLWQIAPLKAVYPKVFSYKYFPLDDCHLWSLLFWEALMFCVAFEEPSVKK